MHHKITPANNEISLFRKPKMWKGIHMRLFECKSLLISKEHLMTKRTKHFYRLSENTNQLITCALNNADDAGLILPREEYLIWLEIALLGNYDNIYKMIFGFNICKNDILLDMALRAGNLEAVKYLLEKLNKFNLHPCSKKVLLAVNDLSVLKYLLSRWYKNKYELLKDDTKLGTNLLKAAASSSDKNVLQFLIEYLDVSMVTGNLSSSLLPPTIKIDWKLVSNAAVASGNFDVIQYLNNNCLLHTDENLLINATMSDNVKTFDRLCWMGIALPNNLVLTTAVEAGCLDISNYLLSRRKDWGLTVHGDNLIRDGIISGNVSLVKRLLSFCKEFKYAKLDRDTIERIPTASMLEFVINKLKNINHNYDLQAIIKNNLAEFHYHHHQKFDLLIQLNLPLTNDMVFHSIEKGNLEIVRAVLTYKLKPSVNIANAENSYDLLQEKNRFNFCNEIEAIL